MPNIFWYYCVIAIGLALLIVSMIKKRNFLDLFSAFLAFSALAYFCEVLVLFVFGSYQYKPGVFKDYIAEDILGHLVCNGFFWGGTAIFVAVFSLRTFWIFLIAIAYMLVEVLFLKVGAYEHHWWKLYLTGAGAFVIFNIVKIWFHGLQKGNHKFLRKFTFFMTAWVLLQGASVVQNLFDKQHFRIGFVQNPYQDSILFSVPYQLCLAIIYSAFITAHKKWYFTIFPLILTIIMDSLFVYTHILNFYNGWNLFYFDAIRIVIFITFVLLERYTIWHKPILLKAADN